MNDIIKVKFEFSRGGYLFGHLDAANAPETVRQLLAILPLTSDAIHTRWCGREISCGISTRKHPPRECPSGNVSKFDICYWRQWSGGMPLPEAPAFEALCIYYGAEHPSYHDGTLSLNIIGHIDYSQEREMVEICERIWQYGKERIKVSLCDAKS